MRTVPPITDFHAHAFPDAIAERAVSAILAGAAGKPVRAHLDGRIASLLDAMEGAGIGRAVICSIATRPEQYAKILAWSERIRSDRIEPFPSVHPRDPLAVRRVREIANKGFRGIKLHPYYQGFILDEDALLPIYRAAADHGLIVTAHTGFDIAFPRERRADPPRILRILERVPSLTFVATHFGGWDDWDAVEADLLGRPVYLETSYSLPLLGPERARRMLCEHPPDRILFGTDTPWQNPAAALADIRALGLDLSRERALLSENANRLLAS